MCIYNLSIDLSLFLFERVFLFFACVEALNLIITVIYYSHLQIHLDGSGCARNCSVLAESMQESHFMIGRSDVRTFIVSSILNYINFNSKFNYLTYCVSN